VKRIDRYIAGRFIRMILMAVAAFTILFVVVDAFDNINRWMEKSPGWGAFLKYYAYGLPYIVVLVMPVAVLLCSLFLVTSLARNNELTAMRASGISIPRVFAPMLTVGFLISVGVLAVGDFVVAGANYRQALVKRVEIDGKDPIDYGMRHSFAHRSLSGAIMEIGFFDGREETVTGAVLEWFDDNARVTRRLDARRMVWTDSVWTAYRVEERLFGPGGEMEYRSHDSLRIPEITDTPLDLGSRVKSPEEMNLFELSGHISRIRAAGGNPRESLVEFWMTLFFPFSSLIMVLVGAPLATRNPRSGRSTSVAAAILLAFIFFSLTRFGQTLGNKGALAPVIAAGVSNALFILLGSVMFFRTVKS
jgi:lipopolysaccharide export system permease protein